jgi:chromosomal replication initiator protein
VLKRNPKAKVRYIHAEQFVADVVRAYQHKSFDSLKRYYRSLDLFLIDDVQFFVGKSRSQEEFFYTPSTRSSRRTSRSPSRATAIPRR